MLERVVDKTGCCVHYSSAIYMTHICVGKIIFLSVQQCFCSPVNTALLNVLIVVSLRIQHRNLGIITSSLGLLDRNLYCGRVMDTTSSFVHHMFKHATNTEPVSKTCLVVRNSSLNRNKKQCYKSKHFRINMIITFLIIHLYIYLVCLIWYERT